MRSGKLKRVITIQRAVHSVDEYGTATAAWSDVATLRAVVVEQSTEEFIRDFGASGETVTVFRTRYLEGVTMADRVMYGGRAFNIRQLAEIGFARGLELRTTAIEEVA